MKVLRTQIPPEVLLEDPLYGQRNPHQAFLIGLSIIASLPLLRGQAQSTLLERELDDRTVILWGCCLLAGSLLALLGEFWPGRTYVGLVLERGGLGLVGGAAAIYAVVTWGSVGEHSPAAELLPWALMCAIPAAAGVAVHGAYKDPPYAQADLVLRVVVGALLGLLAGGYAGAVWHTDAETAGVTYVVSVQAAYAAACLWRVAQLTARLRWIRRLLAQHGLEER